MWISEHFLGGLLIFIWLSEYRVLAQLGAINHIRTRVLCPFLLPKWRRPQAAHLNSTLGQHSSRTQWTYRSWSWTSLSNRSRGIALALLNSSWSGDNDHQSLHWYEPRDSFQCLRWNWEVSLNRERPWLSASPGSDSAVLASGTWWNGWCSWSWSSCEGCSGTKSFAVWRWWFLMSIMNCFIRIHC